MPAKRASAPDPDPAGSDTSYWFVARRPLQILVFLLPLIVAYELCLVLLLPEESGVQTVEAHKGLLDFFALFGIAPRGGLHLGGIAIIVILLAWHVLAGDRWHVDGKAIGVMGLEAIALATPLLILSRLVSLIPVPLAGADFATMNVWSQAAISVGAGLYEELAFRMILIAILHTLLVDIGRMPDRWGAGVAILVSAAAFTFYHDLNGPDGAFMFRRMVFFFIAGVYFGTIYVLRGFGLVVGAHAAYDILTVLAPQATADV